MTAAFGAMAEGGAEAFSDTGGIPPDGEAFGEQTGGWGDAVDPEAMDEIPGHDMDVGGGHSLQLDPKQIAEFLHSDESIAALTQLAEMVSNEATGNAQIPGAEYGYIVQTTEGYVAPQALIMASNYRGVLDEAAHSTLLAAAGQFSSAELELKTGVTLEEDNPML